MFSFDPRTLAVVAGFTLILQTVVALYVWAFVIRNRSIRDLAIGVVLIAVAVTLGTSRPHLPPIVTHFGASVILVAAHTFAVRAFSRFVGRPVPDSMLIGLVAAAALALAFFFFVAPRTEVRIAIYSLAIAASSLAVAALLLDIPRGPLRITHWPIGIVHLLHACFALIRGFSIAFEEARADLFDPSLIQVLWFLQGLAVALLTFTGAILMITQRISLELEERKSGLKEQA
ncbi:MAG: hypothetical protein FJX60_08285 [Alphaproteobacteria bacterium]|nr:hypothetical protein [Alphaproteobacteria bacterium]